MHFMLTALGYCVMLYIMTIEGPLHKENRHDDCMVYTTETPIPRETHSGHDVSQTFALLFHGNATSLWASSGGLMLLLDLLPEETLTEAPRFPHEFHSFWPVTSRLVYAGPPIHTPDERLKVAHGLGLLVDLLVSNAAHLNRLASVRTYRSALPETRRGANLWGTGLGDISR